ncbi:MAG: hypothetical protein ACRD1Z_11275, partial [Vicinamibacteria bacterium]
DSMAKLKRGENCTIVAHAVPGKEGWTDLVAVDWRLVIPNRDPGSGYTEKILRTDYFLVKGVKS